MKKKILWLVTARAGSKSIPDKNIKSLGGMPLLSYRIKSALLSRFTRDLWISTDSLEYGRIAESYGAQQPFLRPESLSSDTALSSDVVLHAMDYARSIKISYEYIGLLEPTSPFVLTKDLDEAILALDQNTRATAIVAVKQSRPNRIFIQRKDVFLDEIAMNLQNLKRMDRQTFPVEVTPCGGFYISRWDEFLSSKTFYTETTLPYELDEVAALEIDEPLDWAFAEFIIEQNLFDKRKLAKDNGL